MKKPGFLLWLSLTALLVTSAGRAEQVWLRQGPFFRCNGEERKPKHPRVKVGDTTFTAATEDGKANSISWSEPPAELRADDEVVLTITSSVGPAPPVLGHWAASECSGNLASDVWDGEAGSWKDAKRAANFNTGRSVFKFKPGLSPEMRMQVGRFDDYSGEMSVTVVWKYQKGESKGKKGDGRLSAEVSVSPDTVKFNERIQAVARITTKGLNTATEKVEALGLLCLPQGADEFEKLLNDTSKDKTDRNMTWVSKISRYAIDYSKAIALGDVSDGVHEIPFDWFKAPEKEGNLVFFVVARGAESDAIATARANVKVGKDPKRILLMQQSILPAAPKVGDTVSLRIILYVTGLESAAETVNFEFHGSISGPESVDFQKPTLAMSTVPKENDEGVVGRVGDTIKALKPLSIAGDYSCGFVVRALDKNGTPYGVSGHVDFKVAGEDSTRGVVQGDATIKLTAGSASIQNEKGEWIEVSGGTKLPALRRLRTGDGGEVLITFPDGATVRLLPNSTIFLNLGGNVVTDGSANVSEIAEPSNGKSAKHEVITPVAGVEPTGTEFSVKYDEATKTTMVKVTKGEVLVTPTDKKTDPVLVRAGQKVWISPRGISGDVAAVESTKAAIQKAKERQALGDDAGATEKTVELQIPANQAWTATGVKLNEGDYARIEASGAVEGAGAGDRRVFYHKVPPEGRDEFLPQMPQPFLRPLSLIGKIGGGSPVLPIGKYKNKLTAGPPFGTGELFLGINDDDVSDNSGAWNVRITVFRKVATPPPVANAAPKVTEKTIELEIPANRAWTRTGVTLDAGSYLRIQASGLVEASQPTEPRVFYHRVPPEGRDEFIPNHPQPYLRGLILLGKLGDGPALPVGKYIHKLSAGAPYGSGELSLGINDDNLSDNSGAWKVRITIFSTAP